MNDFARVKCSGLLANFLEGQTNDYKGAELTLRRRA